MLATCATAGAKGLWSLGGQEQQGHLHKEHFQYVEGKMCDSGNGEPTVCASATWCRAVATEFMFRNLQCLRCQKYRNHTIDYMPLSL